MFSIDTPDFLLNKSPGLNFGFKLIMAGKYPGIFEL